MAGRDAEKAGSTGSSSLYQQAIATYGCIMLWIVLSAGVILINKYVLAFSGFSYPVALTLCHMAFCSLLAFVLVQMKVVDAVAMDRATYLTCVVPISALFSGTLWLGNAAYLYLSVAFIQMLKATMPVTVFTVGVMLGTEKFSLSYAANMALVGVGVATASYGELNFDTLGVMFQSGSIVTESFRLALVQILLQQRGIKLNPVSTLYYIAPACFVFLMLPFCFIELPKMMSDPNLVVQPAWIMLSAVVAFALNMSVFLLIGKTSALTMNVAGVLKDWLLIIISVLMYKSPVTALQLGGYAVAFGGVCWYNYQKVQAAKAPQRGEVKAGEGKPLLSDSK